MVRQDGQEPGAAEAALVYGGGLVAAIAGAFVAGSYALLGRPPSLPLVVLACCGTFVVYQAERAFFAAPEDAVNQPMRGAWLARHRRYVVASTWAALGGAVLALPLVRPATLVAGGVLALVSAAYVVPLWRGRRLRDGGFGKPVVIATAWAGGGVLVPAIEAGVAPSAGLLLLALARFCFVLPNAVLSDWADRHGDARAGRRTLAVRWPEARLRRLASGAALAALAAGGGALVGLGVPAWGWVDLGGPVLMLGLVQRPWPASRRFYGIALDGLVAWPGVTTVALWAGNAFG